MFLLMKKVLITFLFIVFNLNLSFADIYKKITVEEVENIFFNKLKWDEQYYDHFQKIIKTEAYKKRVETRGIAKCLYNNVGSRDQEMLCKAKLIRTILTASERGKVKRPGDIFFVFDAIDKLVHDQRNMGKYIKRVYRPKNEKPLPGMVCDKPYFFVSKQKYADGVHCYFFKRGTLKRLEKLKKDPSNEKILGSKLIKYIKTVRMIFEVREILGSRDYALLGDMMNLSVHRVDKKKTWKKHHFIKNKKSLDLKKRKKLLTKYSLSLFSLEKKIREDNYKSIDKDISKLSNIFEDLKKLPKSNDGTKIYINQYMSDTKSAFKISNFIDEAINITYDFNKFLQIISLKTKKNKNDKLLTLNSIIFMKSLTNSILSAIPDGYIAGTGFISEDLFNEYERKELGIMAKSLKKNKLIRCNDLKKSMSIIDKSFNSQKVLTALNNLEKETNILIKNKTCSTIINSTNTKNINHVMSEVDLKKEISQIMNRDFNFINLDINIINDVRDSASNLASEITTNQANNSSLSEATKSGSESGSILDRKFGEVTVRQLIGAARR
jgi:hypothetical protein